MPIRSSMYVLLFAEHCRKWLSSLTLPDVFSMRERFKRDEIVSKVSLHGSPSV